MLKKNVLPQEIGLVNRNSEIFSVIFENFPFATTLTTMNGKILFANSAITKVLGYSKEEFVEMNAAGVYANKEDRDAVLKVLKEKGSLADYNVKLRRKNGTLADVKLNITVISDGDREFLLTVAEDLSNLEGLEEKLSEYGQKFEFLYENAQDAIMRLSPPDWKFTDGNPATLRMFNIPPNKLFSSFGPWELSPEYQPDGQSSAMKAEEMIQRAMEQGSNFFEWTHKRYRGEDFPAAVLLTRMEVGGKTFLQAIVRDISREKREEAELRKFAESTKTKIAAIIPAIEKLPLSIYPGEVSGFDQLLGAVGETIDILKDRNVHLENTRKAMVSLAEDLASEKNKLENSKKQTETIIESIGDGVFVVDTEGVVSVFNPAAEIISGFSADEVVGKRCCDTLKFFPDDKSEKNPNIFIKETIATGVGKKMTPQTILKRKDGIKVPVADSVSPLKNTEGKIAGCVVVFSDATRERQIEQAKSEFVSLASHQLRTPISSISWFLEMLLSGEIGEPNKKQKEYLEEIYRSNKRMGDMVAMLLNISRIEMGTFIVEPEPTDMEKIIDASLGSIRPLLEKKHLFVEKKMGKNVPIIQADPKLLSIVIDNLLSNAASYTLSSGHIMVSATKKDADIIIEVTDDGIGIPEAVQSKMFSKIFRADNAKEIDTDGTGIGLYMSKSIVESWNGKIRFVSPVVTKIDPYGVEKRVGTSFFVTVPIGGMAKKEGTVKLISD